MGRELGIKFEVVCASSCVPIEGFDVKRIKEFAHEACRDQIEEVSKRLVEADGIVHAAKWGYHVKSESFMNALGSFLDSALSAERPLLVLSQVPALGGNIQRAQRFSALGFPKGSEQEREFRVANGLIENLVERYHMHVI